VLNKESINQNSSQKRTTKLKKNVIYSLFLQGLNYVPSFLIVPISINYVNPSSYGAWLTLYSIIGWFSFFDVGIGHGLRNKCAEAIAKKDDQLAKLYVSTTYASLIIISTFLFLFASFINIFIHWSEFLRVSSSLEIDLRITFGIVFFFFCSRFILQTLGTVFAANQEPAYNQLLQTVGSVLCLLMVFVLTKLPFKPSISLLGFATLFPTILVFLIASFYFYKTSYKFLRPSLSYVNFSYFRSLFSLGINFFIINIAVLVIYSTANVIISRLFSSEVVTQYNIYFKFISISTMLFSIVTVPFWSAFTDAYIIKDILWIKQSIKKLIYLWLILVPFIIIMVIFSKFFIILWVGTSIKLDQTLVILMAVYAIISTWASIFVYFLNGTGKIRLQLYTYVCLAILYIPLTMLFSKYLNLGVYGVIISLIFCVCVLALLHTVQYHKIINNTAAGIWNI